MTDSSEADRLAPKVRLRANALGTMGVAALGVVMMSPALGIYANLGLISASAGRTAPAAFLAALLLTLPTAISYALIAREIPSAGSAYTWLSEAVNPYIGAWVGLLVVITYFISVLLQPMLFALFFNELLALAGIQTGYLTWMLGIMLSTVLVALLAYPGVRISAATSVGLMLVEAVVVLVLAAVVLAVCSGQGRIGMSPFDPAQSLNGLHGFWRGLVFALLSFGGFGVITTAAEETNYPRSAIPRALVVSCVLLGLFWAFSAWPLSLALPEEAWSRHVANGVNPVAVIARADWPRGYVLVVLTALSGAAGVYLAAIVGYARVAYAMGRDGTLPAFFGRLHAKHQVPYNAQHVVLIATLVITALWGRWLGLYLSYDWWGTATVFFWVLSNVFVNIGCALYFFRFRRGQFRWSWHGFIPAVGIVTSVLPLYYSFGSELWNAGWVRGRSIVVFCLCLVALSAAYVAVLARRKPEVFRRVPGASDEVR